MGKLTLDVSGELYEYLEINYKKNGFDTIEGFAGFLLENHGKQIGLLVGIDVKVNSILKHFKIDMEPMKNLSDPDLHISQFKGMLSTRTFNALAFSIQYINELSFRTKKDIMKIRNMGEGSFEELKLFIGYLSNKGLIDRDEYNF